MQITQEIVDYGLLAEMAYLARSHAMHGNAYSNHNTKTYEFPSETYL